MQIIFNRYLQYIRVIGHTAFSTGKCRSQGESWLRPFFIEKNVEKVLEIKLFALSLQRYQSLRSL